MNIDDKFYLDFTTSQGGDIVSIDDPKHRNVERKDHPLHEVWFHIIDNIEGPTRYTMQELLDWVNTGINLFGFEQFERMVKNLNNY